MFDKRKTTLLLLAAATGGLGLLYWKQRDNLKLVWHGYQLYPDKKLEWTRLAWRLGRGVWEGEAFGKRYPHAHRNLPYSPHPRQRLDVYCPAEASGRPVLFFVHGGGWESGCKEMYAAVGREFVSRGYVVVVISHQIYPQVCYPTFVRDTAAALRWTVDHAAEYGGDPNAITLAGHSAGAHIVALLGLDGRFMAQQEINPAAVRGVVGLSGPYSLPGLADYLTNTLKWHKTGTHLAAVMGGKDNLILASPTQHARPDAPPFLLLHGREDRLVPCQQSQVLATALETAGAAVQLRLLEKQNHFSMVLGLFGRQPEASDSIVGEIDRFIRQHA